MVGRSNAEESLHLCPDVTKCLIPACFVELIQGVSEQFKDPGDMPAESGELLASSLFVFKARDFGGHVSSLLAVMATADDLSG